MADYIDVGLKDSFYNFTFLCKLRPGEFEKLFHKYKKSRDLSGVGIRVFIENCETISPLYISEIDSIFFENCSQIPAQLLSENEAEQRVDEVYFLELQTDSLGNGAILPKNAIGLPTVSNLTGKGNHIGVADSGIEIDCGKFENYFDFSQGKFTDNHGKKVLDVLFNGNFAIAPTGKFYVANLVENPSAAAVIIGAVWLGKNGAKLINVSQQLGMNAAKTVPLSVEALAHYCTSELGCLLVAATGNRINPYCSALAQIDSVLSVSAVRLNGSLECDLRSPFKVDCVSLGEGVYASGNLQVFAGASAATALVTGAVALILEARQTSILKVKHELKEKHCNAMVKNDLQWGAGVVSLKNIGEMS